MDWIGKSPGDKKDCMESLSVEEEKNGGLE
jgi:hypothetical protein